MKLPDIKTAERNSQSIGTREEQVTRPLSNAATQKIQGSPNRLDVASNTDDPADTPDGKQLVTEDSSRPFILPPILPHPTIIAAETANTTKNSNALMDATQDRLLIGSDHEQDPVEVLDEAESQ